jgi:hypothetical protein
MKSLWMHEVKQLQGMHRENVKIKNDLEEFVCSQPRTNSRDLLHCSDDSLSTSCAINKVPRKGQACREQLLNVAPSPAQDNSITDNLPVSVSKGFVPVHFLPLDLCECIELSGSLNIVSKIQKALRRTAVLLLMTSSFDKQKNERTIFS